MHHSEPRDFQKPLNLDHRSSKKARKQWSSEPLHSKTTVLGATGTRKQSKTVVLRATGTRKHSKTAVLGAHWHSKTLENSCQRSHWHSKQLSSELLALENCCHQSFGQGNTAVLGATRGQKTDSGKKFRITVQKISANSLRYNLSRFHPDRNCKTLHKYICGTMLVDYNKLFL